MIRYFRFNDVNTYEEMNCDLTNTLNAYTCIGIFSIPGKKGKIRIDRKWNGLTLPKSYAYTSGDETMFLRVDAGYPTNVLLMPVNAGNPTFDGCTSSKSLLYDEERKMKMR